MPRSLASSSARPVAVYGAGGHTGRFVVDELRRRGLAVVAVGRDARTLPAGVPGRAAAIDDDWALREALAGCGVVINCAGPFLDTAEAVVQATIDVGASYLDVTAEQASAMAVFERFDAPARDAGVAVIPAAGFYGGLVDQSTTACAQNPSAFVKKYDSLDNAKGDSYHQYPYQVRFYLDELYNETVIAFYAWWGKVADWLDRRVWGGAVAAAAWLFALWARLNRFLDSHVVDGSFDKGCEELATGGGLLSRIETGRVQTYLRLLALAVVALVAILIWSCRA